MPIYYLLNAPWYSANGSMYKGKINNIVIIWYSSTITLIEELTFR